MRGDDRSVSCETLLAVVFVMLGGGGWMPCRGVLAAESAAIECSAEWPGSGDSDCRPWSVIVDTDRL